MCVYLQRGDRPPLMTWCGRLEPAMAFANAGVAAANGFDGKAKAGVCRGCATEITKAIQYLPA